MLAANPLAVPRMHSSGIAISFLFVAWTICTVLSTVSSRQYSSFTLNVSSSFPDGGAQRFDFERAVHAVNVSVDYINSLSDFLPRLNLTFSTVYSSVQVV